MTFWFCKITQKRSQFALTLSNAEAFLCFQYLPWQKKNAEATEFSAIIKTTFPRKRKNILLFKKEKKCCTQ